MASAPGKENIADGLFAGPVFGKAPSLSPRKSSRKTRSKSIGPGGLEAPEEPALKESHGNRRKSAFIPAVKSILSSNDEDEKKRRRKSLARRRVSFAPEATLHTWDVVEYLRDATTSSASSEATRRASNASEAPEPTSHTPDSDERASTPPEKIDEPDAELGSSPANQRDAHQKKNRRSSGIPPMNFNNPDDISSSSPMSGDNNSPEPDDDADGIISDNEETAKFDDLVESHESDSMRLDAALRQASAHAGTHRLSREEDAEEDSDSDMSMEIADDEVTTAFKPWAKKAPKPASEDEENVDPFSAEPEPGSPGDEDDGEDMSMDITRAIGSIVQRAESPSSPGSDMDMDDISMDLTMPLGVIKSAQEQANRRKSLKRRASLFQTSQGGSPAKRPASRRTSLRQRTSLGGDSPVDDATMDFTVAIGKIKSAPPAQEKQTSPSPDDQTMDMDFTVAIGSIKNVQSQNTETQDSDPVEDEDMSMEFTNVLGGIKGLAGIKNLSKQSATPEKPVLMKDETPVKSKTPSPKKSKSPEKSRLAIQEVAYPDLSPQVAQTTTPKKSPGRPRKSLDTTPKIPPPSEQIEKFEPSPFVRRTPQSAKQLPEMTLTPVNKPQQHSTPTIPEDPVAAPILNRRRSSLSLVQFSPLATAREEPPVKNTSKLSDSIRLLSTPRKQSLMSPVKRGMTPKKSQTPQKAPPTPKQKTPTPKKATPRRSLSPRKRVAFGPESPIQEEKEAGIDNESKEDVERISLQEFLDMTKIRFMELSTTKRRHTAAPGSFHSHDVEEKDDTLDSYVVAAACTLPEYELYQHACHEMKKYISDGRHFVRTMEANVMEENPLLFTEYLTAPPDQRAVMDNQFKNLKTSARLDARGEWYTWRSTLLRDLKIGLLSTLDGFKRDESVIAEREKLLDAVLPPLVEQHGQLETQCKQLQQRHDELNSCDREELEQTREQLVATDAELEEKRRLVAQLQRELDEKEARIKAVKERKVECLAEIKAAEKVREECRGWSTSEVNELKDRVTALEQAHGWSIASASSKTITMTHLNDLELYFQPSAFSTGKDTPNGSISLAYVGDSATPHPRPLTTSKRFFLQLIRAHLHCIPQSQTRIASLLALVKNSWAAALSVAEGVRWLEHNFITDESILSDERMAISANLLLPSLQTKIRCTFEIAVSLGSNGVETQVEPTAELVYGEKYKVEKMRAFLKDFCGGAVKGERDMAVWADGVLDLKSRLEATGRKGERA